MQIGKKDMLWSYFAQGLRWGNSLIILPFVLKLIPSEHLAFWYLFATINSLVMLFDFGFSPTIVRNVTYVFCGARKLLAEGIQRNDGQECNINNKEVSPSLLKQIIVSSQSIYRLISIALFFIIASLGTYYIYNIIEAKTLIDTGNIWLAWGLTIITTTTTFYYLYLNALLFGRGYVRHAQKATVISNLVSLVITLVGLFLGYGIVAMSVSLLISLVVNRALCKRYFFDKELTSILLRAEDVTQEEQRSTIKILWYNAKKLGIVGLGGFLITRTGQFFVTSFFALSVAAEYGLTMQIITIVSNLSFTYYSVMFPKIAYDYFNNNIVAVKKHFGLIIVVFFVTFVICCIGLLLVGTPLLNLMGSQTKLLPTWQIIALFVVLFLENQHAAFANIHTIQNKVPFVKPALFSGIAIVVLTYFTLTFFKPSIWSLIGVQFIVQLVYNNWKWVYDACNELKITYFGFYKLGFIELYNHAKNSTKWKK